jgi:hypothetical protein
LSTAAAAEQMVIACKGAAVKLDAAKRISADRSFILTGKGDLNVRLKPANGKNNRQNIAHRRVLYKRAGSGCIA